MSLEKKRGQEPCLAQPAQPCYERPRVPAAPTPRVGTAVGMPGGPTGSPLHGDFRALQTVRQFGGCPQVGGFAPVLIPSREKEEILEDAERSGDAERSRDAATLPVSMPMGCPLSQQHPPGPLDGTWWVFLSPSPWRGWHQSPASGVSTACPPLSPLICVWAKKKYN